MANEKWREMTYINDYEFDPDGKYDGSLYKEDWEEIFNDLYQRAETTEEWRYNDWIEPQYTRNAYTYRVKKNGEEYIVLKYYDGMYALYEIKPESEIAESTSRTSQIIDRIESGVSVRQAICEAVQTKKKLVFEDVAGMNKEEYEKLLSNLDKWTGGSGKGGWEYATKESGDNFIIELTKNPITKFDSTITLDVSNNVLNGDVYYEPTDEYLAASGPVTFAGLKSIIRDLTSQVEMASAESDENTEENQESGDIYGY